MDVVALLALLAAVTEGQAVRSSTRTSVSVSGVLVFLAAVLFGPMASVIVAVASMTARLRGPICASLTYLGIYASYGAAAGAAFDLVPGAPLTKVAAATFTGWLVNFLGLAIVLNVRRVPTAAAHLRQTVKVAGTSIVFVTPVVFVMASAYWNGGGLATLVALTVPLLACHHLFRLYKDNQAYAASLSEGNMTFALSLVRALDARDAHTAGHSASVAVYARDVAIAKGLPGCEVASIQLAALLHDIGKIGVPTEVLLKRGKLDDDEWAAIRAHPQIGADIAGEAPVFAEIARFIRHHHERPDGRGYPDGLVGDRIPLASAIIGVADSYNAMTSCRPYRDAMTPDEAIAELRHGAGTQFDPQVVDLFIGVLVAHDSEYRLGLGDRFSLDGQRAQMLAELGARREVVGAAA